ncbi:sugar phosphate isomerase/epimerase family protein [Portibacter lacus]|uniref:Sugar phosphate isomerase n=1 Tax=Portibacter lacus TaxID=1099794 RepID=A0AA37WEZ0_9BACT|nr:sugar phosphate isomerase/epimerase [Portibacter lacus]GLR17249.1 sugar phosphate isomerase [Portibacter lacus]
MNRRKFIAQSGIAASSLLLPWSGFTPITKSKYKLGYQLYSIRDLMANDPIGVLEALKKMGYKDFEAYGFDDIKGEFYGFKSKSFKQVLDDLNLTVTSGHYNFSPYLLKSDDELEQFVDRCIEGAMAIDSKYITWPFLAPELRTIDNFKIMSRRLNVIGEQVTKAGLGFAYHNHGFEFEDHGGENGFDIIIADTDADLVKLEMDMYWVMHSSKFTPKELIDKQPGRYVMWHIKDMDKVTRDYTELGNGSINYLDILPDPERSGLEYFYIEQGGNFANNSMQSAKDSAKYFKRNLKKLI